LQIMGLQPVCASKSGAAATENRRAAAKEKAVRSVCFIATSWQHDQSGESMPEAAVREKLD